MSRQATVRKYGKQQKKSRCDRLFAELPQSPVRPALVSANAVQQVDDAIGKLAERVTAINIQDENEEPHRSTPSAKRAPTRRKQKPASPEPAQEPTPEPVLETTPEPVQEPTPEPDEPSYGDSEAVESDAPEEELRVLCWSEVCPPGDRIMKIAEASYAEVYRVTNERGTSIIKVIRMESPIKAQTKPQQKSGLVDEEPHSEADLLGELQISEWLADIPGFVVYKERYIVQGKACRELLETHQAYHKRAKRQDPGRLQFYPSPSRYLDDTRFLVIELGDAGTALEDFQLLSSDQLWDIFFHVAIALARAEAEVEFEHRDLHEGNLCIRQVGEPVAEEDRDTAAYFGHSGFEITILDYGLSRARGDLDDETIELVAYDLERDLSLFASEHAPQCRVYRQMRSFLLRGDRVCLPPKSHKIAYAEGVDGPISWALHEPYTNVLWLAYLYDYLVSSFLGPKKELNAFKRITRDFWTHLNPEADDSIPGFASASDIVMFAVESGWIDEDQLMGGRSIIEKSILSILSTDEFARDCDDFEMSSPSARRSPRRHQQRHVIV
ncbi:uncharacterized protein JN550_010984 [Neoarthrinium moseri]|uniref:uncharacterized protein n=1 Tax=Neoarthrinium moseri TaxID=1658444 RepID=UPI001FDB4FDF|nr:uncharacterized protein JN550_010984 [Neoarthrinium moseri]KAI1861305.1 hypothetical protein JN550_010984 [Neoarthrinium moseri]